jgi:hypothetical protein
MGKSAAGKTVIGNCILFHGSTPCPLHTGFLLGVTWYTGVIMNNIEQQMTPEGGNKSVVKIYRFPDGQRVGPKSALPSMNQSVDPVDNDSSVLRESDFVGPTAEDDARREMLKRMEAYEKEKADLLRNKLKELKEALSNEISNGGKVDIQEGIDVVQAELDVVEIELDKFTDSDGDEPVQMVSLPDYTNLAATVIHRAKSPLWEDKFVKQMVSNHNAGSLVPANGEAGEKVDDIKSEVFPRKDGTDMIIATMENFQTKREVNPIDEEGIRSRMDEVNDAVRAGKMSTEAADLAMADPSLPEEQPKLHRTGFGLENLKKLQEITDQVAGLDPKKSARMDELVKQLEFTQKTINGGGQMVDGSDLSEYYQAKHDEFDSLAKEYEAHSEDVELLHRTAERATKIDVIDPIKSARMAKLAEDLSSLQTFIRDGSKEDVQGVSLTERYRIKHDEFDSLVKEMEVNVEDLSVVRQKAERVAEVDQGRSAQMQRLVNELQFLQNTINGRGQMADGSDPVEHYKRKRVELDVVMDEIGVKDINILEATPAPKVVDDLSATEKDIPPVKVGIYETIDQVTKENEQLGVDQLESLVDNETLEKLPEGFQKEGLPEQYAKEDIEPSEHWQLKRAMREAESNYLTKLEAEASQRGKLQKMFGFGRKKMTSEVQLAYDNLMAINNVYYKYAVDTGWYKKLNDRQQRERTRSGKTEEAKSIYGAVAERHVLKLARERLAIQERQLPPKLQALLKTIAGNPKLKWGLLGASVAATAGGALFGMLAGKLTKMGLEKTYVKGREEAHERDQENIVDIISSQKKIDLEALEKLVYASALAIDSAKVNTNIAGFAVGAATTAGATYGGYTIGGEVWEQATAVDVETPNRFEGLTAEELGLLPQDAPTPGEAVIEPLPQEGMVSAQEAEPTVATEPTEAVPETSAEPTAGAEGVEKAATAVDGAIENKVLIKAGDTVSKVLLAGIKARLEAGLLTLPPGFTPESYIYQTFPEMTNAADAAARLTPQEWFDLGVISENPNEIIENQVIDIEGLIAKMPGISMEVVPPSETFSMPLEGTPISEVDGGLVDSVTVESSAPESIPAAEKVSIDKIHISKNGTIGLVVPEGQIPGVDNVVSPFAKEVPFPAGPGTDLIEVMMERINEGIKAGRVTLDPSMTQNELRYLLLDRLPELKQPDEVLWFQRTATPSLTPEVWTKIGVPGGDPLEIPVGTKIDMQLLLNKAIGFEPAVVKATGNLR